MQRAVIGFRQDEEMHWVAMLECGHSVHVRHDPPWTVRAWVTTEEERMTRVGTEMRCKRCEEGEVGASS